MTDRDRTKYLYQATFKSIRIICLLVALLSILAVGGVTWADDDDTRVKIGVLAKRGAERCIEQWGPTADYLTAEIPGYSFEVVPLDFEQVLPAVERGEVDFILANSSFYVELEVKHGVNRLVTLKNLRRNEAYTVFGGVIFCKADRDDIQELSDLTGKSFIAAEQTSFGGWRMAWRELKEQGIDPYRDFTDLQFGGTHDAVVYAVRDGAVDAGTVRTDTLERMAAEGKIDMEVFRILNQQETPGFLFVHSTRLYPEWPLAKVKHTPDEVAQKVAVALLQMPADSPAAQAAVCAGWTIPLSYQPVHECLKELRLSPYEEFGKVTLADVIRQYWYWLVIIVVFLILMTVTTSYVLRLNRRLGRAGSDIEKELSERKLAEADRGRLLIALERRSAQLQTGAEVSRAASSILDPDELIQQVVELIRERFGLYYVGLFQVDKRHEWAILRAGTGEAGRAMLARGHRIRIGEGMIGWSIANAQARIASQAEADTVRLTAPELPQTHSEAALPLRSRGQVIGALTVQSDRPAAFDEDTIVVLQTMADQVAVAMDNARLFAESQEALEVTTRAHSELGRKAWEELLRTRTSLSYQADETGVVRLEATGPEAWEAESQRAWETGHTARSDAGEPAEEMSLALPIRVRGETIGVLDVCKPGAAGEWTREETAQLETLVDQLGVALENARLYEETQQRAERERLIAGITARVRSSMDPKIILQTAVRELGAALGTDRTFVQVGAGKQANDTK